MPETTIMCAKLRKELPALDENSPEGSQALKMALLLGGPDLQERVRKHVSADAWSLWKDRMMMVINEYRLDPTSDASNPILLEHMELFLFGDAPEIPNYKPPEK